MTTEVVRLTVNGRAREALAEPRKTLVDFLREDLHLTGTHVGCEHGVCGACTVLVDGVAVRSCLMLAVQARGADCDDDRRARSATGDSIRFKRRFARATASSAGSAPRVS